MTAEMVLAALEQADGLKVTRRTVQLVATLGNGSVVQVRVARRKAERFSEMLARACEAAASPDVAALQARMAYGRLDGSSGRRH